MTVVIAFFNAIVAIPPILKAVTTLITWITNQLDQAQKRKSSEDMKKATEGAKNDKDTSGMDQIFNPGKKK